MKERIDAIALTEADTLVSGWIEVKRGQPEFKADQKAFPHLTNLENSFIDDILIEHDYGDRYWDEAPFDYVLVVN